MILRVAARQLPELRIFGNDWNTLDGTCLRDYIHIMDLAEVHMVALNYLIDNSPQFVEFNVGTGIGTSVLKLINTLKKLIMLMCLMYSQMKRRRYPNCDSK